MWLFCRCALRECRRDRCADRRSKEKTWTGKSSTGASGYDGSGSCSPSARDCQGGRCTGDGSTSYKQKAFEEVMRARANGQEVYAETCPQYLLLDDSVYTKPDFRELFMSVHLRFAKEDQDCLWEALSREDIQTVATDQCSFTLAQKALGKDDFTKILGLRESRHAEHYFIRMG